MVADVGLGVGKPTITTDFVATQEPTPMLVAVVFGVGYHYRRDGFVQDQQQQHRHAKADKVIEKWESLSQKRHFLDMLTVAYRFLVYVIDAAGAHSVVLAQMLSRPDCKRVEVCEVPVSRNVVVYVRRGSWGRRLKGSNPGSSVSCLLVVTRLEAVRSIRVETDH